MTDAPVIRRLLFTVDEAAERLHVPPSWLYQRTSKKAIPFRKLGKYVRFSEQDLQAIIDQAQT
jgi:excisionase family DNA binding protein